MSDDFQAVLMHFGHLSVVMRRVMVKEIKCFYAGINRVVHGVDVARVAPTALLSVVLGRRG